MVKDLYNFILQERCPMNQFNLENSINRYNRKRNSYDVSKINSSIKNGKKSLPEVFIDLNNHSKKNKLLEVDRVKLKEDCVNQIQITHFNDGKGNPKNRKTHKKQTLVLKNLYATQSLKENGPKNILNDYKAQIQALKQSNDKLRQELKIYKSNDQYLNKKLFQLKQTHLQQNSLLKQTNKKMEIKMATYQTKIKQLYEELIAIKKTKVVERNVPREVEQEDIVVCNTVSSENNRQRIKGQLYSYRNRQDSEEIDYQKFKRLTSPTSHSRGKHDKSINKWFQQQRNLLKKQEDRGEQAYYRTEYIKHTNHSQFAY